jgi:hypothetical protein
MCLGEVRVPHCLPHPAPPGARVGFPAGADRARRSRQRAITTRYPGEAMTSGMTSTTPRSHCQSHSGTNTSFRCPPRTVTRYDQQAVTLAGRKARRDVLSSEIGSFPEPFRRRGLSPQSVSAQLRPGKHLLTAIHGAHDDAIDGAHVAVVFVGIVAARSSTCRKPAEYPCSPQRAAGQCCRAASAPRGCAPVVRVGLPSDTWGVCAARGPQRRRHSDGADREARHGELSTVRRHGQRRDICIGSDAQQLGSL